MTLRLKTLALTLATVLVVLATTLAEPPRLAAAATTGAGYSGITPYGGFLGNYIAPDGSRVYCIDSGADWPSGATSGPASVTGIQTQWGGWLSVTDIRQLNYALLRWGQTADPTVAAGVSALVYAYTSNYAHAIGAGYAAGAHYINGNTAVLTAYNWIWSETQANFAGAPGHATVSIAMANSIDGTVTIATTPSSATGTLTLTGAVVAGTSSTTIAVRNGSVVPVRGTPSSGTASYSIAAAASFVGGGGADQRLLLYTTGSQQRTIRGISLGPATFGASDETEALALQFSPIVTTQVSSRFVGTGGAFIDTITAEVATGSPEWGRVTDGSYLPVVATGTLYGPFSARPDVAAQPPAGAPIVGRESVTLAGPGNYASAGSLVAPTAGFYTWVWTIAASTQPQEVAAHLPDGYRFADRFGLVAESHVVPMSLSATSQVTVAEVGFGGIASDQLSVSLDEGAWLTDSGVPIEAVFEGVAYFVPGSVAPAVSTTVPADVTVLATSTVRVSSPGIYSAPDAVTAPSTPGYITWVWALSPTSPFAPYFEPWADDFGVPAETTRVAPPTVATQAMSAVAIGDDVHDTALIGGTLPALPSQLVFQAYLQVSGSPATCDESTIVFDSSDAPVEVSAVGRYDSPSTTFTRYGTYLWVESLLSHEGEVLHRGVCGAAEETTLVAPGEVATQAVARSEPGGDVHDTAMVSGVIPRGTTLIFEAFAQHGILDGPLCDAATRVFTSAPVAVVGAGRYESSSTRLTAPGTYYWVETLLDRNGEPLHVGVCGIASETTTVQFAGLATTGVSLIRTTLLATALILAGIAIIGAAVLRHRREYR